jgi:hypothetical protein
MPDKPGIYNDTTRTDADFADLRGARAGDYAWRT